MRKTKIVTIDAEGRDKGKSFLITEFPAMRVEKWAARCLLALSRAGVEVPDEAVDAGAIAILSAGLNAFRQMAFDDAEPLLDEMLECVQFVGDPNGLKDQVTGLPLGVRTLQGDDIEEVATLLRLRGEVFELHVGFSLGAALSTLGAAMAVSSPPTRTSRKRSAAPSARGSRRSTSAKRSTA